MRTSKAARTIIGIDPDSKAHGIAVYSNGTLNELMCGDLTEFMSILDRYDNKVEVHIEDVNGVSAAFMGRDKKGVSAAVRMKMAQHIGMCKQSQIELERVCEHAGVKVVKHKISKMWKKDKAQFEKVTGWNKRSNEDSRSAAWFGYLGTSQRN